MPRKFTLAESGELYSLALKATSGGLTEDSKGSKRFNELYARFKELLDEKQEPKEG